MFTGFLGFVISFSWTITAVTQAPMEGVVSMVIISAYKFSTLKKQGITIDSRQLIDKGLGHCYQSIMEILPFCENGTF